MSRRATMPSPRPRRIVRNGPQRKDWVEIVRSSPRGGPWRLLGPVQPHQNVPIVGWPAIVTLMLQRLSFFDLGSRKSLGPLRYNLALLAPPVDDYLVAPTTERRRRSSAGYPRGYPSGSFCPPHKERRERSTNPNVAPTKSGS